MKASKSITHVATRLRQPSLSASLLSAHRFLGVLCSIAVVMGNVWGLYNYHESPRARRPPDTQLGKNHS